MVPASPDLTGVELLERFADVRLLRTGSRFTVYEARDPGTRRAVVIKTPNAGGPSWLGDVLDHEATILAAISAHPNIVTLYQRLTLSDDRPALVLEHCTDPVSQALGDGGRMPAQEVVSIGIKLAGALETAHGSGAVHCDVRPGNVLRSEWGEPMLSGFEQAIRIGDGYAGRPAEQLTTPHTAPELLQGEPPTVATDVYGLAATLYELVAGRSAFRAYAGESPAAIIVRVLSGTVRPIVDPAIPLALSDLLTWAMDGNPARRPPSPAWMAEELGHLEIEQGWPRTRMIGP